MLAKTLKRLRRKNRIRAKISGTSEKPRLSVFRSNSFISVQLIDDTKGITLASASDLKMERKGTKTDMAKLVGAEMAKKIKDLKIEGIVFDRGGFIYHGRVKALAEALREGGIKF
ncbi:50S ribosomal protein L18 [Candidatus Gracilibacteria bacterium HOT-871]|nr:50S ribosomal protein L18 [Candidatus Gracilibacteria bacterium HOT-871]MBB1565325.1 50S ribosomal protein L18 [Candidatus Gracilibacteria bacterium]RKW23865.1 MAG: 50S ribosomal protein L18 [Candidatus Gracilibacteria bacterium]